jgi:hypothetical protein
MGGLIGMVVSGQPGCRSPCPFGVWCSMTWAPALQWSAIARIGAVSGAGWSFHVPCKEGAEALRAISLGFGPHSDAQWM